MSSRGFAFLQPNSADFHLERRRLIQQSQSNNSPLSEGHRPSAPSLFPLPAPGPPCQALPHPFTCVRSGTSFDQSRNQFDLLNHQNTNSAKPKPESVAGGTPGASVRRAGETPCSILFQPSCNPCCEKLHPIVQSECRDVGDEW